MINSIARQVLVIIVVVLMSAAGSAPVYAQSSSTPEAATTSTAEVQMVLRPDGGGDGERLEVEIAAGDSAELTVYVGNLGNEQLGVRTYVADLQTKVNGGLEMLPEDSEKHEPTTWAEFNAQTFEIESGQEYAKTFTVSVPPGTESGQYVIPIAAQTVDSFVIEGSANFRQIIRKVIPVYVTVPGEMGTSFTFGEPEFYASSSLPALDIPITNTGDTVLRLSGSFTLKDASGGVLLEAPIQMAAFYRGHETVVSVGLSRLLPEGEYLVTIDLTDAASGVSNGFEDKPFTMPNIEDALAPQELVFENVAIEANAEPIQFASIAVDIANAGSAYPQARLTLGVSHDGEPVEDFVLSDGFTVPQGTVAVQQRYLPVTGWETGTYTFSLKLEAIDPSSGATSLLLESDDVATIEVP